jgi:16S rRNA processing protein RimM
MKRQIDKSPQQNSPTGSPLQGEPVFIAVGYLRRPHGIHGEMIMDVLTDFPERLGPNKLVYLGERHEPIRLASLRWHGQALLVSFREVDTPEAVGRYRNTTVFVRADELPTLPKDEYYHHQLLEMRVVDELGQLLGILEEILVTGANDVYVVRTPEGGELLIPAIESVVLEVSIDRGEMIARPPEWG